MRVATRIRPASALGAVALVAMLAIAGCKSDGDATGSRPKDTVAPIAPAPSSAPTTTTTGPPAALPATFPKGKVPLPRGAGLTAASEATASQSKIPGWTLTFESTTGTAADLAQTYRARLKTAGFGDILDRTDKDRARRGEVNFVAWTDAWTVSCVGSDIGGVATLVLGVAPHRTLADLQ